MTNLDDVKAFLAVANAGSFSRAAEQLSTAKSVVSRRVARLESDLGTRLFTRSSRGVVPTESGEALRIGADSAFEQLHYVLQSAAQRTGELTGVLRVTAPVAFGTTHLSGFLSDFMREHPRLNVTISFSDRRVDILADGFDVAVRMGALSDSTLIARRIAPLRLAVLASPDYLARHGTPSRPRDLAAHDCIVYGVLMEISGASAKGNVSSRFALPGVIGPTILSLFWLRRSPASASPGCRHSCWAMPSRRARWCRF